MFARPVIDSVDFARHGRVLRGEIGLAELSRLSLMLVKPDGALAYVVRGYQEGDREMLEVSVRGSCVLRCQRCLGEMIYPIDLVNRLLLLPADRLAEADREDEVEAIETTSKLDVLTLIEDEVLLDMPYAPKHPEGECVPAVDVQQKAGPFTVLAKLRNRFLEE